MSFIPLHEKLIVIRCVSVIFMHNFDKLSIEHYGRVWERIVIILNADKAHDLTKCKRRKRRGRESRFKFLVGNGQHIAVCTQKRIEK